MEIAIQAIQTTWTKTSRGGQGAAKRNAVPKVFPLPLPSRPQAEASAPHYLLHQLRCAERDDFHPTPQPLAIGALLDTLILDRLSIHPPDGMGILRVTYHPRRPSVLPYARDHADTYKPVGHEALALQLGEWGRVRYNWRHTGHEDAWWYDAWTVNIGFFRELAPAAFLERPPGKVYSQLARLR